LTRYLLVLSWIVLCLTAGCSDDPTTDHDGGADAVVADAGPPDQCPTGLRAVGSACAPRLSTGCKDNEVPLSDGGCKQVGVEECDGGIKAPPGWTCKHVGPPEKCLTGWSKTSDGWCEPDLPSTVCPDDKLEVIGKTTCQEIGDCGSGTWGKIKTTANTTFVDKSYTGGSSDGSQTKPFTTIADALKAGGAHIAVAAGTYDEDVLINTSYLRLEGVCAKQVVIKGQSSLSDALSLGAAGITVSGVTVTGPGVCVAVAGTKVTLEHAIVSKCGGQGVAVVGTGELTVRDALLAGNGEAGVGVDGAATLTLKRVVARGNVPTTAHSERGYGVVAANGAAVTIEDSLLTENTAAGAYAAGATLTIKRSAIRSTKVDGYQGLYGVGVSTYGYGAARPGKLVLEDCLVEDNIATGVLVGSAEATIQRCAIVGTLPSPYHGKAGQGIQVHQGGPMPGKAKLTLKESLVAENHEINVIVSGGDAVIERCVVKDGQQLKVEALTGYGVQSTTHGTAPGDVTVRDSVIEGNTSNGVSVVGSKFTAERSVIRDTLAPSSKNIGAAVATDKDATGKLQPTVVLRDCLVTGNAAAGLHLHEAKTTLERTIVRDTRPDPGQFFGFGIVTRGYTYTPTLAIDESVIANNRSVGVIVVGGSADLERTVIRDTRPEQGRDMLGIGLYAAHYAQTSKRSTVKMSDCLVLDNRAAGVSLWDGSKGTITRTVVKGTRKDSDGKYGDGLVAGKSATLELSDSLVTDSARAGALFTASGGAVTRSVFRSGQYAVDLESGAKPKLYKNNVYEKNEENRVTSKKGLTSPQVPETL
jgi:hypothetical protein